MYAYIFPNLSKTNCKEYTQKACEILNESGVKLCMNVIYKDIFTFEYIDFFCEDKCIEKSEVIIAIGGDGTILQCSVKACVYDKPVLGINCGRLGFMASLENSQLMLLKRLAQGNFSISRRMMLNVCLQDASNKKLVWNALNDVVFSRSEGCKIADFEVSKGGQLISSLRADGLIFSTPTGATAYSMSAGGPIIEPEMECIEFTQICPHSLFARSMILSSLSVMKIKCHTSGKGHVCINVDGNSVYKLYDGEYAEIMKSDKYIKIIDICGGSFFSSINRKLMRPLKDISEGD